MRRALGLLSVCLGLLLAGGSLVAPAAMAVPSTPTAIYVMVIDDLQPPVAGRPLDFTAVLADSGGNPVPGETLTLSLQPVGAPAFAVSGISGADGRVTVSATLDHNAVMHWSHGANPPYEASSTPDYGVQVAPLVTARAHDRTLHRGQRLVVTGRTFPAKGGCTVKLWKGVPRPLTSGPEPRLLARSLVRVDGSYRLVRRLHRAAASRVSVTVSSCAGNARGLSHALRIRVR